LAGALLGTLAGVLQYKALGRDPLAFAQAVTAMDVRRALTASPQGRASVRLTWINGVVLLLVSLHFRRPVFVFAAWFSGYFSFMLVRDLIAFPGLGRVAAAASARLEAAATGMSR
jgi:hypothetical protein